MSNLFENYPVGDSGSAVLNIFVGDTLGINDDTLSGGPFGIASTPVDYVATADGIEVTANGLDITLPATTFLIGMTPILTFGTHGQEFVQDAGVNGQTHLPGQRGWSILRSDLWYGNDRRQHFGFAYSVHGNGDSNYIGQCAAGRCQPGWRSEPAGRSTHLLMPFPMASTFQKQTATATELSICWMFNRSLTFLLAANVGILKSGKAALEKGRPFFCAQRTRFYRVGRTFQSIPSISGGRKIGSNSTTDTAVMFRRQTLPFASESVPHRARFFGR